MEDGGELEGTFECSNRTTGRLRNREGSATGGAGGLRRGSRDDSGALTERNNQNTISPPGKQSPILWQNGQGGGYAGESVAAAAAATAAGEEALAGGGRIAAALERAGVGGATGAGSSGSGSVMSSVARLEASSPRGNRVTPSGTASAVTTPVGVGIGGAQRKTPPTGGGGVGLSTAVRAPSPLRPTRGLQVQGLGAEAGELFSEEAVTPVGESGGGTDLPSARRRRSSATAGGGGGDGSAEEEGTGGGSGGTSVAARVGTWPPPSPVPSSTRLWQRRTEVGV